MFSEISAKEISGNIIEAIANEWMLISAGNENGYNMMTASWGFMGEMWGEDCVIAAVRPHSTWLQSKYIEQALRIRVSWVSNRSRRRRSRA